MPRPVLEKYHTRQNMNDLLYLNTKGQGYEQLRTFI